MMYVERDEDGKIKGAYACKQPGYAEESVADDSEELLEFVEQMWAILTKPKQ